MSAMVLTMLAPAVLKEDIVAAMLACGPAVEAGFTVRTVEDHGRGACFDSIADQVRGYTSSVEFVVVAEDADLRALRAALSEEFAGRGIAWRVAPVASAGII